MHSCISDQLTRKNSNRGRFTLSRSRTGSYILAGCLALSASFPSFSQQAPREAGEPEAATGYVEKQALASKDYFCS